MTMPSGDHEVRDIEVPLRLQPVVARPEGWRGRSINLIAVGLVGFVVIGVLLSTAFGNRGPSSPASGALAVASGSPGPTARPTRPTPVPLPLATPLPTMEVHGTVRPSERRLVYVDGPDLLDLGSGTLRSLGRTYEDVLWPVGSEYVCICVVRSQGVGSSAAVTLQFGRFDETGERLAETDLVAYDDVVAVPEMTEGFSGFNIAATMDAAGDHLFVVATARRPPVWIVELHIVDVDTGSLLDSAVIDSFPVDLDELRPSASQRMGFDAPDGVYAWAFAVAATPDGETVFVRVALLEVLAEAWTSRNLEWFVPIGNGAAGDPLPMPEDDQLAPWCIGRPTFVDAERLVQVCGQPPQPGDGFWSVRRLTTAGKSLGDLPIGAVGEDASAAAAPLVDRERRAVYLWDSFRHLVGRVDLDTGSAQQGLVDDPVVRGGGSPSGPAWTFVDPGLVLSGDRTRLYALGLEAGPGGGARRSTGIWVFDADTLEMLDHWEPRALLTSLAVSADGRFVYAAGAPGYDADGHENQRWPASLTVYDATSGEIAVLYGAIGEGQWLGFPSAF